MRNIYNQQRSLFCQWKDHKISRELQVVSEILDEIPEINRRVYEDLNKGKIVKDTIEIFRR